MKLIEPIKARVTNIPKLEPEPETYTGMSIKERVVYFCVCFIIFSVIVALLQAWPK
jgi:hypothetical protein